jgi:acyl carrier protein
MLKKVNYLTIMVALLPVVLCACTSPAKRIDINSAAKEIAEGVGNVGNIYSDGEKGQVFVFGEYHTSQIGRLQTAVMLDRLYRKYDLKIIGLEGAMQRQQPISGGWFHTAGGDGDAAKSKRENVSVIMLSDGEINSAELMELVYPVVEVYGIELPDEYEVTLKDVKGTPRIVYLIAIAEKYSFSQAQIKEINDLIRQDKKTEAIELMLNTDPWTKEYYAAMKDRFYTSTGEIVEQIDEIKNRASELNIQVDSKVAMEMEKTRKFFDVASQRSYTMVDYITKNLITKASGNPVAMIIGAAHIKEVLEKLKTNNISYAQITPIDLNPEYGSLTIKQFERKNQGKWAQTDLGSIGRLLNSDRNPPPIIETVSCESYASTYLASILLADLVHSGVSTNPIPNEIKEQLQSLPELRVDIDSITTDGYDVIFRMWAKNTKNEEVEIWGRVGITENKTNETEEQTLENKLLKKISKMHQKNGDSSKLIPIDQDKKAVFSGNRDIVITHSRISG